MRSRLLHTFIFALFTLFAAGCQTGAQSKAAPGGAKVSKADQEMMEDLAHANLAEIVTGKMALSKSQDPQVRQYAQRMIDDHTKAQSELAALAKSKGVILPTETDVQHKALGGVLNTLSGNAFDKQYMSQVGVADHKRTHQLLEKANQTASDPELRALAQKTMPIVSQHLNSAQQITGDK